MNPKTEEDRKLKSGQIFIQPPVDCDDMNNDLDSGNENVADGDASVLRSNQVLGCAVLEIKLTNTKVVRGNDDKQNKINDNQDLAPELKKKKKNSNVKHINKWKHSDLLVIDDFEWNLPILALDSHEPPSSLFEMFLTVDILQFICNESVRYAQSKRRHSYKLELHDLKAFIAILLICGYVDLPRRPIFLECSADVHNDAVSSMISRNRFDEIIKYLNLADNISLHSNDKLRKVQPLLNKLNEQCLSNNLPEQTVSINESMVPYFGRHGCKQFMKNKPVKFGYKLWVAATPLGYAIQFYPYMGKDDFFDPDLGLGGSVVDKLTDSLPKHAGSNYHIITDNFFTSPQLLRSLREKGIAATGTVRLNRVENAPLKPVKEMEKLERGSADVVINDNAKIAFVRWKGNKVVPVISSKYGLNPTAETKQYIKEKKV